MHDPDFDVIIVGYGPVSEVLAIMLGRQGRRVAIFERWNERYTLPRAVCIDHEMYRMLSAIGMGDVLPSVSHPAPPYRWYNAEWRELLCIDWSRESISGGTEVNFVHQPTMEAMFDQQVRRQPHVQVNLGWEVREVSQDGDCAWLAAEHRQSGERRRVSSRYLIGCDGANSVVRRAIGGSLEDRGFEADWLVIDILPHADAVIDIPPAAQWCNPMRPTTIVPAGVHGGRRYRRWEFMRLPGESVEELEEEDVAWDLLRPWVRPDQASIVRHKIYTFRSLLAKTWRNRRLLIAGDAAHVMPPFMGQGMCSGLRDDWNLAWKLDLILDGRADPALLDSYQQEREPHVSDLIDLSMYLGRLICQPDPVKAAERDQAFFTGSFPPPPPFPQMTAGILHREPDGSARGPAGLLAPHGQIRWAGAEGRFDDLVGTGRFQLIAMDTGMLDALQPNARAVIATLPIDAVALEGAEDDPRVVTSLDGKYARFLDEHRVRAMIIRPDFHVYGGADDAASLSAQIVQLAAALHLHPGGREASAA